MVDLAAVRAAFRAGSSAAWPLWLVCAADAYDAFAATWVYFRWADDIVDAPGRVQADVLRFVADQRRLVDGGRAAECLPEAALRFALSHPAHGPRLTRAADSMMAALEWDARRGPEAPSRAELEAQITRIGDAFALAIWACTGGVGEPSGAARELARAATAAHQVRDLREDLALGYCNVPREALPSGPTAADLVAWAELRADVIDGRFRRALAGLSGVRWRARLVFTVLAWRYRRGLPRWARLSSGAS